jgi:hypothetical protein
VDNPLGQKIEAVEKTGISSRSGVASSSGVDYDLYSSQPSAMQIGWQGARAAQRLAGVDARCGESPQQPPGKFEMYARVGNILLSLLGPAYFGFTHSPYVVLVVWSAACAAIFFWSNRASLRHARQVAYCSYPVPLSYMAFFTALLYVGCSVALLLVYSVLYFFVELLI